MNKFALVVILLLSFKVLSSQTKIIAHRGFSGKAPENTLIAFQKSIECRADYFELDVHKTKNDSLVVIHDPSVDRTSSNEKKGQVSNLNYRDLTTVNVGFPLKFENAFKDEKIPTLREALALAKGKIKVCIEIKVYGIEEEILEIINDLEMHEEVIIFSFKYPILAKIRQLNREIPILFLMEAADKTTIEYAKVIQANAIGVGLKTMITKAYLDFAHKQGIEVWQWTVNNESDMEALIDMGIDGLITDYPDVAITKLKKGILKH